MSEKFEGYEPIGEYRLPKKDEWFIPHSGMDDLHKSMAGSINPQRAAHDYAGTVNSYRVILRKVHHHHFVCECEMEYTGCIKEFNKETCCE